MSVRDNYKNTQRWRWKARQWVNKIAGDVCQGCGYDIYFGNLAFHHLGQKDETVARLINRCASWDTILQEVNKCVLVCHNCHGEIHAGIRECPQINLMDRQTRLASLLSERPVPKTLQLRPCAECGNPVPSTRKYCDQKCAHKGLERVEWPENLIELVQSSSSRAVARRLGVSDKAVKKRMDRGLC